MASMSAMQTAGVIKADNTTHKINYKTTRYGELNDGLYA